jgi:hypothetical protein
MKTALLVVIVVLVGCSGDPVKECTEHFLPGESGYPRHIELTRQYLREGKEDTLMDYLKYVRKCEGILRDAGIKITVNK